MEEKVIHGAAIETDESDDDWGLWDGKTGQKRRV